MPRVSPWLGLTAGGNDGIELVHSRNLTDMHPALEHGELQRGLIRGRWNRGRTEDTLAIIEDLAAR